MVTSQVKTNRLKIHLWTLPRWFAAPFFGLSAVLGALIAGGMTLNSWLGVIASLLVMAGGHAFNSFLDYAWTGLDKGEIEDRSAEKGYTGGQNLLVAGRVSLAGVAANALVWYLLALGILIYLAIAVGWPVLLLGLLGMLVTFWYSKAKFNWTHELALGVGVGPLPALVGMFATTASPPWLHGILAGVPFGIVLSFAGLALDEYPDAAANLKKGVKSIAYKVWEYGVSLEWYLTAWISFSFIYQILMITIGIYRPLTAISFLVWPFFLAGLIFLKKDFNRATNVIIIIAAVYFILITIGQIVG